MIITKLDIDEINKALLALQKTKPTKVVENNNVNINTECAFTDAYKQKLDSLENTVIDYSLNEYSNNPVANSILYQRLEAINESIDLLNTNVSTNTTDIESINSAISNINTQINSHSTSIQSIESDITSIENAISNINTSLNNKVDKVTGKGLSTNDFTNADKTKLDGLHNTVVDTSLSSTSTNPVQNKVVNTALETKVDKNNTPYIYYFGSFQGQVKYFKITLTADIGNIILSEGWSRSNIVFGGRGAKPIVLDTNAPYGLQGYNTATSGSTTTIWIKHFSWNPFCLIFPAFNQESGYVNNIQISEPTTTAPAGITFSSDFDYIVTKNAVVNKCHISNTNDVNKTYSENDPFVIGSSTALNMAIDNNEIMARNNNQLSTLYLNPEGGDIVLSTNDSGGSETSRTKGNVIQALNKLVIPTSQPANLENGCIWIHPSGV